MGSTSWLLFSGMGLKLKSENKHCGLLNLTSSWMILPLWIWPWFLIHIRNKVVMINILFHRVLGRKHKPDFKSYFPLRRGWCPWNRLAHITYLIQLFYVLAPVWHRDTCKCPSKATGLAADANVVKVQPCWEQLAVYQSETQCLII